MMGNVIFILNTLLLSMLGFSLCLAFISFYLHHKEDEYKRLPIKQKPYITFWKRKSILKRKNENDKNSTNN